MSSFDDLTYAITGKFNDTIRKSCSSLFAYLNLNNFWYYKVSVAGHFSFFGTHLACCEYFSAQKCYRDFFYYRHPKFFQSGISLQKAVPDPRSSSFIKASSNTYNLHHSLLMLNKTKDGIEGFGFSSPIKDEIQLVNMLNDIPLLRLFTDHFRRENKLIFSKLEDNKINLIELIGPTFYKSPTPIESASKKQFLLKTFGLDSVNDLSPNEVKIVKRLLEGYSANQIASQMFRSKRTVEHSMEKIKEKLCCDSKTELIQKAREMERLGVLDSSVIMIAS